MSGAQPDGEDMSVVVDSEQPSPGAPGAARIVVRCAGRTAVGQVRDHNEDNFVVANLGTGQIRPRDEVFEDAVTDRGLVFAVCDGMGGAAAGEVASQMAVDILVEAMRRGGTPRNRDALAHRLVSAVEEAGRRIFDAAQKERSRRGMGTTATVAVLVDKVLFLAEVGDSRAYLLRRGQLKQLTKDQSLVNQLIEAGHLTEDEAEAFEHSNIILQALGTSETVQVDLTFVELRKGDRLMMCSDGLSGLVHLDALRATLDGIKDPADSAAKLIELAESAGGHDNITVVVADFDGEALSDAGESDTFGYVQYPLPLAESDRGGFLDEETTAVGERVRPSDAGAPGAGARGEEPDDDGDGRDEDERDESLLPLTPGGGDVKGSVLWVAGGVMALAFAALVWLKLQPIAEQQHAADDDEHAVVPAAAPAPAQDDPGARAAEQPAAAEEVEVNVHTDVEQAILVVNGESKGELSSEQSRSLRLKPGAYRFVAQSAGNAVAVTEVTVGGDMPMDVFLALPKGKGASAEPTVAAAPEPAPEPAALAGSEQQLEPKLDKTLARKASPAHRADEARPREPAKEAAALPAVEHARAPAPALTPVVVQPAPAPSAPPAQHGTQPSDKPGSLSAAEASVQQHPAPAPAPTPKPEAIPDNPF